MSVGEASGEAYAALLVKEIKQRVDGVEIDAIGGSPLALAGANVVESLGQGSVVGLVEGVRAFPTHVRALKNVRKRLARGLYDLVILLDYPGFHLRVAAAAAARDVPVLYYIAPQLWAWGSRRIESIRKHVRRLAVVLPFEEEYFRSRGVAAEYVGHPLLDREAGLTPAEARAALQVPDGTPALALFPGSRQSETDRLWPAFRDAARILTGKMPELRVLVAAKDGFEYPGAPDFQFCLENSELVLAAADAALCKSGTATLQAAIAGTPMVIAYKMHPLTFAVARRSVGVPDIGLVNLIAGRRVCPEFLQGDVTSLTLADAVGPLLDLNSGDALLQRRAFSDVLGRLGGPGATRRVANIAEAMIA